MTSEWIFLVLGSIMLVIRIWLCEIKLVEELSFRRRYVSRFLNNYFWIAMIFNFQNTLFNLIIITGYIGMLITFFGWDTVFFYKFKSRTYWKKNHGWLIFERLTMHVPSIIIGTWMYFTDTHNFVDFEIYWLIIAILLVFTPWVVIDRRFTEKYIDGMKFQITLLLSLSSIGVGIYFIFF